MYVIINDTNGVDFILNRKFISYFRSVPGVLQKCT